MAERQYTLRELLKVPFQRERRHSFIRSLQPGKSRYGNMGFMIRSGNYVPYPWAVSL